MFMFLSSCYHKVSGPARMAPPGPSSRILLVNLRFLQFATVVGVDHLPFGEDIQPGQPGFAVAVAGAARAAEGELDLRARRAGVDVQNAGGDIAHSVLHAVDVLR